MEVDNIDLSVIPKYLLRSLKLKLEPALTITHLRHRIRTIHLPSTLILPLPHAPLAKRVVIIPYRTLRVWLQEVPAWIVGR